jgi:putative glutamine amidotransferase
MRGVGTPLVAIPAYHLAQGRVTGWTAGGFGIPDRYVSALQRAGVRPCILTSPDPATATEILQPFGGLLLVGGGDVEPTRYGEEAHTRIYGVEPDRDALEIKLARTALDAGLPIFAICRGMQILNVALGGTLLQHLGDVPGLLEHGAPVGGTSACHRVRVAPGTRLAKASGGDEAIDTCTSHHHQAVDRVGDGLVAVAWSDDGMIEAVEPAEPSAGGWVLAVQWHPEMTAAEDPAQQRLFDAFATEIRSAGRTAPAAGSGR